jgi:hypothetical protein
MNPARYPKATHAANEERRGCGGLCLETLLFRFRRSVAGQGCQGGFRSAGRYAVFIPPVTVRFRAHAYFLAGCHHKRPHAFLYVRHLLQGLHQLRFILHPIRQFGIQDFQRPNGYSPYCRTYQSFCCERRAGTGMHLLKSGISRGNGNRP